jgi:hypothetical protein
MPSGIYKRKPVTKKARLNMSKARRALLKKQGYLNSLETRKKISKNANTWNKGETKETSKQVALNAKNISKVRQALFKKQGFLNSPETIEKIRKSLKITNDKNRKIYNGYTVSPKTREKHSIYITKRNIQDRSNFSNRGYCGDFFSAKNNCMIHYASSMEYGFYMALEYLDDVIKYEVQPFWIEYKDKDCIHHYMPDAIVYFRDGSKQLIEIKPEKYLKDLQVQAKAIAARKYCRQNNMEYKFYTENGFFN